MKRPILFLIIFLSIVFLCPAEERDEDKSIYVSTVRIIVDGEHLYNWTDGEAVPGKSPGGFSAPSTIISFLSFKPGDRIPLSRLERMVKLSKRRLNESGFFYSVSVSIVPPRKYPDKRTVLIKLTEGFRYRFGGGSAYAFFGMDNIGGKRIRLKTAAGYNLAGGGLYAENLFEKNIILGGEIYYSNAGFDKPWYHKATTMLFLGYRFIPDLEGGLNLTYKAIWNKEDDYKTINIFYLLPYLKGRIFIGNPEQAFSLDLESSMKIFLLPENGPFFTPAAGFVFRSPPGKLFSMKLKSSGGTTSNALSAEWKYNLSGVSNNFVRGAGNDLLADKYLYASLELMANVIKFRIPPIINITISPYLYGEAGYGAQIEENLFETEIKDHFGFGLRIDIPNPISFNCSLSYGWDHRGEGAFVITFFK